MLKTNNLSLLAAGASITSLGIGTFLIIKQYLNNQKLSAYTEAMDNVLSKSSLMKKKNKGKNANKKTGFNEDKLINKSGFQNADDEVKAILIESRNKKNRKLLDHDNDFMNEIDEEQELKKSLDDFEQVINQKIKISSTHFEGLGKKQGGRPKRKESAKNEFSEMISEELQFTAGSCNSVCLARVDEEAYICFTCMRFDNKVSQNQNNLNQNILSTEDDDDDENYGEEQENEQQQSEEHDQYFNQQLDIMGVQRGVSQIQTKELKKKKSKKSAYPSLNQCQFYCWSCIQEHHSNHQVSEISSQSSYISNNPNLKSSLPSSKSISDHYQIYSPKLSADQQIYLSAIKEQMEMQQMNSQTIGLYCCTLEQILVSEENIPVQIENHLSQELNLIFDSLFDRVQQAQTQEFNNLLHIILKRIDEIMIDNNILIYIMGRILIKKNIIDRILRYDSLESQNQKKFSEILMKMAKVDSTLRSEIAVILLQDFKYVFVSHVLCSALLFMLKSAEVRQYVTQKLNKTSQFCAGLLNIKSIFEKFHDTQKYRNKLLRCLYVTRALCEDRVFVVEGILNKATKQFSELLCDIARYLEKKSLIHKKDFFKNLIHTDLGEQIFFLKNLDFHFRLLFNDFVQNAHYAPEKYRQQLWQKLSFFLKQNIDNFKIEIEMMESNTHINDKKKRQHHENQNDNLYLNNTSLNMVTIMQREIRCKKFYFNIDDYAQEAHFILKKYLFSIQEGYQILLLHHYGSVVNNPQNRCLFEHVKYIYGFPEIGDFDLITYLQQSTNDSNFVKELFMKNNFPSFDLYQNLRILFTDYSNQLGQLLINILQINHQELPLSLLLKELNRYVHIDNISSLNLNIFCEIISQEEQNKNYKNKFHNEHIYRLKKIYYYDFFPLIFCKYPEDYDKLIKQQQLTFKLKQFDQHFTLPIGNQILSGPSNSSEEAFTNAPKILNANFFNNKDNSNDIFGSDYDFILVKDRLIAFHSAIMDKILPTAQAFFMIDREDPLLCMIIQLYIRIILFQAEASPSTFSKQTPSPSHGRVNQIKNIIPENVLQKMKTFKSINKYLINDVEYMKSNISLQTSTNLKRHSSSNY